MKDPQLFKGLKFTKSNRRRADTLGKRLVLIASLGQTFVIDRTGAAYRESFARCLLKFQLYSYEVATLIQFSYELLHVTMEV